MGSKNIRINNYYKEQNYSVCKLYYIGKESIIEVDTKKYSITTHLYDKIDPFNGTNYFKKVDNNVYITAHNR